VRGKATTTDGARAREFNVTLESKTHAQTIWVVREVTSRGLGEPSHFATTYPDSSLISLETFKTRRSISPFMGRGLLPGIRAAILAHEAGQVSGGGGAGQTEG
jgi:hypothetical protein